MIGLDRPFRGAREKAVHSRKTYVGDRAGRSGRVTTDYHPVSK